MKCPPDRRALATREYARCPQVMLDVCPACHGIWLDRGEIEALEIFLDRSRHEARPLRLGFFASLRGMRHSAGVGRD